MVSVYIDGADVTTLVASEVVYNRNRRDTADFGKLVIVREREQRYEPNTRVLIGSEQYLIESDNPLELKNGLWEHEITLIENIAIFSTIFPTDRSFTRYPSLSIKEILTIYQRELKFYQDFEFDFDTTDSIYDELMINKQYQGLDFAVIVYDLFRKINAIPRVTWNDGWYLSYELFTDKNNEITLDVDSNQSNVNDIDYATELLNKTRNTINEENLGVWFPSKDAYVTPRSKSTMLQTSDYQFELDSNINLLYKAIAYVSCELIIGGETQYVDVAIDFTEAVVSEEEYATLPLSSDNNPRLIDGNATANEPASFTPTLYKQNTIKYSFGSNIIDGLFYTKDGKIFTVNVEALYNAITQFVRVSTWEQYSDIIPTDIIWVSRPVYVNTEDIKCKFYYRPERDIDFITEKHDNSFMNKVTIANNQKDSSSEITRFLENSSAIINRIGNKVTNVTQRFNDVASAWVMGDYFISGNDYWLLTNAKYVLDKIGVTLVAEFNKNFSNTNRESGVTREPTAYLYTGNTIQSNYIYREYLCFYEGTTEQEDNSNFRALGKKVAMNLLDYSDSYNKPLTNLNYLRVGDGTFIDMPIYASGGGNTMIFHVATRDGRLAGNGLKKINGAWYKNPVYYTDKDNDYELGYARVVLSNTVNMKPDISTMKYYPRVNYVADEYISAITMPFDKDPNNTLALTFELVVFAEGGNIIIPNGFTKYNNLIRYYETTPSLTLYSKTTPYTIFDKKASGTIKSGLVTLDDTSITVTDLLGNPIEYWALVYNDEIILAGNNSVSVIKYLFSKNRKYVKYSDNVTADVYMVDSMAPIYQIIKQARVTLDIDLTDTMTVTYSVARRDTAIIDINLTDNMSGKYDLIVQYNNVIDINLADTMNVSYDTIYSMLVNIDVNMADNMAPNYDISVEYGAVLDINMVDTMAPSYSVFVEFGKIIYVNLADTMTANYDILIENIWVSSDSTYWNDQDALGKAYTLDDPDYLLPNVNNYTLGDALRITDGTLPVVYTYWKVA